MFVKKLTFSIFYKINDKNNLQKFENISDHNLQKFVFILKIKF